MIEYYFLRIKIKINKRLRSEIFLAATPKSPHSAALFRPTTRTAEGQVTDGGSVLQLLCCGAAKCANNSNRHKVMSASVVRTHF